MHFCLICREFCWPLAIISVCPVKTGVLQGGAPAPGPPEVTLAVHPLSRRYQTQEPPSNTELYPGQQPAAPPPDPQQQPAGPPVNQTKDNLPASYKQSSQPAVLRSQSIARAATEKLKWKFLGW